MLLVSAYRWLHTVRAALAAREAGFDVALLAPVGHPVGTLSWVETVGSYSALRPAREVARVVSEERFDLVVPVDDLARAAAFDAYAHPALSAEGADTLRRSLGAPGTFPQRGNRYAVAQVAEANGVPTPSTRPVADDGELDAALAELGLPVVLKADGLMGGEGVRFARGSGEAHTALRTLRRQPRLRNVVGGFVRDDNPNYLRPFLRRPPRHVVVQPLVAGIEATMTAAAWQGELLGAVALQVVSAAYPGGPAAVVSTLEHPGMLDSARRLIAALGISGFCGLDFFLLPNGEPTLLELNSRATHTSHLAAESTGPLWGLLAERITGLAATPAPRTFATGQPIALFPQERLRDPGSTYVGTEREDVPVQASEVVDLIIEWSARPIPSLLGRAQRRLAARRPPRPPGPAGAAAVTT